MAKNVQQRRTTAALLADILGKAGQIYVNTSRNSIHVMDAVTLGGFELGRADASNIQEATTEQDGKMTSEQATALAAATADIVTLEAATAQLIADLAELEASVGGLDLSAKANKVSGSVENHIAILTGGGDLKSIGMPFFASGTKMKFASAVPPGFTLHASWNDSVDLNQSSAASVGDFVASTWAISGGTVAEHAHDAGSLTASGNTGNSPVGPLGADDGPDITVTNGAHSHTISVSVGGNTGTASPAVSFTGAWRPPHVKTVWATRNAAS